MTEIQVAELMTDDPRTVTADAPLVRVYDLMAELHCRHIPVVDDDGELVGLVSDRDLIRNVLAPTSEMTWTGIRQAMEGLRVDAVMVTGIEVAEPDESLADAAQRMLDNKYGCLPVVVGQKVVGILTESDFVRHVAGG